MKTLTMNIKKLYENVRSPTYGTEGAACIDLYAPAQVYVNAGEPTKIHLGLSVEVPEGYALLILPRSSIGFTPLRMANSVGVIDSDYRGEICALYECEQDYIINEGDRIAQAMLVETPRIKLLELDTLRKSKRGCSGFGSTGR